MLYRPEEFILSVFMPWLSSLLRSVGKMVFVQLFAEPNRKVTLKEREDVKIRIQWFPKGTSSVHKNSSAPHTSLNIRRDVLRRFNVLNLRLILRTNDYLKCVGMFLHIPSSFIISEESCFVYQENVTLKVRITCRT